MYKTIGTEDIFAVIEMDGKEERREPIPRKKDGQSPNKTGQK